jgi:hypothetical protein
MGIPIPIKDSPQLISRTVSKPYLVYNSGAHTVYLGQDSSVSPLSYSFPLASGNAFQWTEVNSDVYGVCDPGLTSNIVIAYEASALALGNVQASISGPVDITGSSVAISGTPTVSVPGGVAVSGNVGITGTPAVSVPGGVAVSGNVGITGTPNVAVPGGVAVSGNVGITGTPTVAVPGGVAITGTPNVAVPGGVAVSGNVGITGTPNVAVPGGVAVSGNVGITGTPTVAVPGGVAITGTPNVAIPGGVAVSGSVGITGTPNVAVPGGVAVSGNVGITGTPNVAVPGGVGIVGTPNVAVPLGVGINGNVATLAKNNPVLIGSTIINTSGSVGSFLPATAIPTLDISPYSSIIAVVYTPGAVNGVIANYVDLQISQHEAPTLGASLAVKSITPEWLVAGGRQSFQEAVEREYLDVAPVVTIGSAASATSVYVLIFGTSESIADPQYISTGPNYAGNLDIGGVWAALQSNTAAPTKLISSRNGIAYLSAQNGGSTGGYASIAVLDSGVALQLFQCNSGSTGGSTQQLSAILPCRPIEIAYGASSGASVYVSLTQ